MEKRERNFQPIGICQKLFNFFMNNLIAPGLKRITTGHPASHESIEVPVEEGSRNREQPIKPTKSRGKPKDNKSSEVIVEFRHTNGLYKEHTSIVSGDQTQLQKEKGNDRAVQSRVKIYHKSETPLSQVQERTGSQVQGQGKELENPSTAIESHVRGPKKTHINDNARDKEKSTNIPTGSEDRKMKPPRPGKLLTVASNINEKSDVFINSRKEAMRNDYNLEPSQS